MCFLYYTGKYRSCTVILSQKEGNGRYATGAAAPKASVYNVLSGEYATW
jgi:hypothetical protein